MGLFGCTDCTSQPVSIGTDSSGCEGAEGGAEYGGDGQFEHALSYPAIQLSVWVRHDEFRLPCEYPCTVRSVLAQALRLWQAMHPADQLVIHQLVCRRTAEPLDLDAPAHHCLQHGDALEAESFGTTLISC